MPEDFIKNNKIAVVCAVFVLLAAAFALPLFNKVSKNTTPVDDLLASTYSTPQENCDIYIDISGAVKAPGVYRMRPGSRMTDLVNACGGFEKGAQAAGLNLAQVLKDGDKIVVPSFRQHGGGAGPASASGSVKVNINVSDQKTLETIPGIGPSTAKKILEYRALNGPFAVPEDIKKIKGISASKFEKLKQYIDVF
jgi:competence protein ComEA